ncbi:DNA polymerase III subunit beta [Spiractinospora alimapuensis]|uniref:DNA polymerase III subunit beta n=1 Tax=Spiractinospora alimapuensis TaxID=2820884 RepID=UPI001F30DEFB|nr:DNA polymerase III subunit beta [Spiractinospora alimapuensis]QVQ50441.1 DNA polymerase III subunit beta [Spiractinospora alimapuensis]
MRFQADSAALADAVAWAARALPSRPSVPVLAGVRLEVSTAGEAELRVSSFDYEVSAQGSVAVWAEEPGGVLVPGRLLADIVRRLPAETATVTLEGGHVRIEVGRTVFTVPLLALEDHPRLPELPQARGSVASTSLASAVRQVAATASKDDTLPILTGIHVEFSPEQLRLVSTDRYRIAVRDLWWQAAEGTEDTTALVPARSLLDVVRSFPSDGNVALAVAGEAEAATMIGLTGSGWTSTVRLLDGPYVGYESRFPDDFAAHVDLPAATLAEAVKRVASVAERHAPLRLSFGEGLLVLSVGSHESAQAIETVDAELTGDAMDVSFSPQFLLDGLVAVESETVRVRLTSPTRPAVLGGVTEDGRDDPSFRYLTMPLRPPS